MQDVGRRLDKVYDSFFRRMKERRKGKNVRAGFPRFKYPDRYNSITYAQSGFKIMDNGHVWLSRLGKIRTFMHRSIMGDIKTISVKRDSVGDWFITLSVETCNKQDKLGEFETTQDTQFQSIKSIGVDLGLNSIITTSGGMQTNPTQFLRKSGKKLTKAHRHLSRKKKGSGKRRRSRTRVAKIHRKMGRQRDDLSHKLSRNLVENHDFIAFEALNIMRMMKNHHLAKSIADASWNTIVQYTTYKTESAGNEVVLVDPRNTSKQCSKCGYIKESLKLSERIFHCDSCGIEIDRYINATINIRNRGLKSVGRGIPEVMPVEIGALLKATPVAEAGSPLRYSRSKITSSITL